MSDNAELIDELIGLCSAAGCPNCNGDGAYYDNHGEVCQCQWCDEFNKAKAKHKQSLKGECEHGEGMSDYCLPCGRINGGS